MLDFLVRKGLNIQLQAKAMLDGAAHNDHVEVIKWLLNRGVSPDLIDDHTIIEAESGNSINAIKFLVEENYVDVKNAINLIFYVEPSVEMTEWLLEKADLDVEQVSFLLFNAVHTLNINIVRVFLEHGADPSRNNSAILFGVLQNYNDGRFGDTMKIINLLIDYGADVNAGGGIIFEQAIETGNTAIVRELIKGGALVGANYDAALKRAVQFSDADMVKLLIGYYTKEELEKLPKAVHEGIKRELKDKQLF